MQQVYINYEGFVEHEDLELIADALDDILDLQLDGGSARLLYKESEDEYITRVRQTIDKAVGRSISAEVALVSEEHLRAWEDGETILSTRTPAYGFRSIGVTFTGVELEDILEVMQW